VSLTAADVAEIMRLVEQSVFDELTLEINGMKLSLRRGAAGEAVAVGAGAGTGDGSASDGRATQGGAIQPGAAQGGAAAQQRGTVTATSGASAARAGAAQASAPGNAATHASATTQVSATTAPSSDPNIHDVPSPLLGTFYRAPKPGAPPFVEIGSPVEENTIVAIIEVMKLMNTVRAGVRGTVAEIVPGDGTLVEYDQPILRIRKTG
jgi:acetyl-CoA carboxylase biotin carboxyl carrier protein